MTKLAETEPDDICRFTLIHVIHASSKAMLSRVQLMRRPYNSRLVFDGA